MKNRLCVGICAAVLLSGCVSQSHQALYQDKPAFYAYVIGEVRDENPELEYAKDVYTTPASCQKIVTTLIGLKTLGLDYRYRTALYVTKEENKIKNVRIYFSGDPTLTSEDLLTLLSPLRGKNIDGEIILDASLFQVQEHSPNVMIADIGTDYGQPVSSMNIDKNLITLTASPEALMTQAQVKSDMQEYKLRNAVQTTSEPSEISLSWKNGVIEATGNILETDAPIMLQVSPPEETVDQYALHKMKKVMDTLNMTGSVRIVRERTLPSAHETLINTVESVPLTEIIVPILKESDNLMADVLYLTIMQSEVLGGIAEWNDGDKVIKKLIHQYFDINMDDALFVDGSGLSRLNRIQPKGLYDILQQGYFIEPFVAALPAPGEMHTTLEKRKDLPSNIRAKTGSLSGVACLSGFSMVEGNPKLFVIMVNGFTPAEKSIKDVIDQFVSEHLLGVTYQ